MSAAAIRRRAALATAVAGLFTAGAALADPDEAWLLRASLPAGVSPLLALVVDLSAAAGDEIAVAEPYDSARDYRALLPGGSGCDPARVYWRRGAGPAPDCSLQSGLALAGAAADRGLRCEAARAALARQGFFIAARAAQWRPAAADGHWTALRAGSDAAVECRADRGRHGADAGSWYAADGGSGPWTARAELEIAWDRAPHADAYVFFAGNFLNYLRATPAAVRRPVAAAATQALATALAATAELDVALLRVNDADGGFVARAPVAADVAAADLQRWSLEPAAGGAPLAETLAEAAAWLSGGNVRFGGDARADPAAFDLPGGDRYRSPFTHACRPVTLAMLTAGQPSADDDAAAAAAALPGFTERIGACAADCLQALGEWIGQPDLRADLPGAQLAPVHWLAPAPTPPAVAEAASASTVTRIDDPLAAINLVARSLQHDAAVAARPQLSAPAIFADPASAGAPQLVFGLRAPRARSRWHGNLLKYGMRAPESPLAPPVIVDRDGDPAIDAASGLPLASSRSHWSDAPDASLLAGGAAGRLPDADGRRIQSDLAGSRILDSANDLAPGNPRVDRALLGLGAGDPESIDDVLSWLASARPLGDPGLHAPVVVDDAATGRQFVFAATHDGLLQAFDAASGIEAWAWLPRELLPRLVGLLRDETTTVRDHGIDGALVLHRFDPDGDGRIDTSAGEHRWLLFGLGRGGHRYHALDLASMEDPRLLWSVDLPGGDAVDASAAPVLARLAIAGSGQSAGNWVVMLAGGYDRRFDDVDAAAGAGNELLVLDAATGRMLWRAAGDDTADLTVPGMTASIAAAPRVLDLDGDGYADRAYLADVAGGLWRFDFTSGRAAGDVAQARLLARLGTGPQRFHATPDLSVAAVGGRPVLAIALGSGWLARPREATITDRIYLLFDREGLARTLVEEDLHDASDGLTAMPGSAPGWYWRLEDHGPGEKIVGPAVTFNHLLRFQTYQPAPAADDQPCGPPRATQRRYAIDIRTGLRQDWSVEMEGDDLEDEADTGLPVALRFGFPARRDADCSDCLTRPFGLAGGRVFDPGYAGDPVRTSWRKLPPPASP
jgi:type IV pilus assembly protein PilY1